jgi:muramoyltetrapeptide carboxypeptidase LdcA involved in peptidoglycan recycling
VKVAVLSPSGRAAALFPGPYALALARMQNLGLETVEYPTTTAAVASPQERARDIQDAFADPRIEAVFATIGGDDQIKVLPHLDLDILRANPKPFFGHSDNTNLHIVLWNLGIPSYYGGSTMVTFGRAGEMHPVTQRSLEAALRHEGFQLNEPAEYGDEDLDWRDFKSDAHPPMQDAESWKWHGRVDRVEGRGFGGNLEILDFQLRAHRWLQPNEAYAGCVLFLETSEELPDAEYVYRVLMGMGERGLLQQFAAVLWGRPKAWNFETRNNPQQRKTYVDLQYAAVLRAFAEYHPEVPLVVGVDFGHTDPQYVLPSGGRIVVDAAEQSIVVAY